MELTFPRNRQFPIAFKVFLEYILLIYLFRCEPHRSYMACPEYLEELVGRLISILNNDPHPAIQPGPTSATMIPGSVLTAMLSSTSYPCSIFGSESLWKVSSLPGPIGRVWLVWLWQLPSCLQANSLRFLYSATTVNLWTQHWLLSFPSMLVSFSREGSERYPEVTIAPH